jgi:putative SOS response-associated peptidase YedK
MCGRFTLEKSIGDLATLFQLPGVPELTDRFNIAPTQPIAVIRSTGTGDGREMAIVRWGLIPAWAKEPGAMPLMINARAETAATKPAFRTALRRRRCLVPADGFYEWQRQGSQKQPYHMRRTDGGPFALAGLWDRWEGPDGCIDSCALLTTTANELMSPIHDRMPVILEPQQFDLWLDPALQDVELLRDFLRPYPSDRMVAYPVPPLVNNARNDDPQCVLPLE